MNALLLIVQALLALHTVTGALWKLSHSAAQTMPSLKAIPPAVWAAMAVLEIASSVGLVLPALLRRRRRLGILPVFAAAFIALEMLSFCALHLLTGGAGGGPIVYWLVVAAAAAFIAYGRLVLRPLGIQDGGTRGDPA